MWHCEDCGKFFEDPGTEKDYHYELDYGRFYETLLVCPSCRSTEIRELTRQEEKAYRNMEEIQ